MQEAGVSALSFLFFCCYLFLTQLLRHGLLHWPQDLWSHTSPWVSPLSLISGSLLQAFFRWLFALAPAQRAMCFSTALASFLVHSFCPVLFCPSPLPCVSLFFSIPPAWPLSPTSPSGYHPFLNMVLQRCHKPASCLLLSSCGQHRAIPDLLLHGLPLQPCHYQNINSHA